MHCIKHLLVKSFVSFFSLIVFSFAFQNRLAYKYIFKEIFYYYILNAYLNAICFFGKIQKFREKALKLIKHISNYRILYRIAFDKLRKFLFVLHRTLNAIQMYLTNTFFYIIIYSFNYFCTISHLIFHKRISQILKSEKF